MIDRILLTITTLDFWVLFLFAIMLPYMVRYMRRFYPKHIQENIKKCEMKMKNYKEKSMIWKETNIFLILMFFLTLFFSILLLWIIWLIHFQVTISNIKDSIMFGGLITFGLIIIFNKKFYKYIYGKEEHPYIFCDSDKIIMKHMDKIGYLFVMLSIVCFVQYLKT